MREVDVTTARKVLSDLILELEAGPIALTKHGKVVALLSSPSTSTDTKMRLPADVPVPGQVGWIPGGAAQMKAAQKRRDELLNRAFPKKSRG
jgi:antitoxin (DNA-binding transcriptional repressor) of toxin-antitoxin stability system